MEYLVGEEVAKFIDQFPAITIRDGVLSADVEQPYYLRFNTLPEMFVVIDTTGTITENNVDIESGLLLTKSELILIEPHRTDSYDLSEVKSFDLDGQTAWRMADDWVGTVWVGGTVVCIIFSFICRAIQVLIYGALGLGLAAIMGKSISFAGAMRIAAMAITPVIVLGTLPSNLSFV